MVQRAFLLPFLVVGIVAAGASATPRPSLLVFEAADGLHVVNSDGTGLRSLAGTRPGDQNPHWSPDGERLLFWHGVRPDESDGLILVADADGSGRHILAAGAHPEWSPDGHLIVFTRPSGDGGSHVYVMRADGSQLRPVDIGTYAGWWPNWAPEGGLSFDAMRSTPKYYIASGIMAVALDGSNLHALPAMTGDDGGSDWSSDGTAFAFTHWFGDKGEIEVETLEDGHITRLTHNHAEDDTPMWSPDGAEISFTSSRNGLDEVYVMNADGSGQRRVTRFPTIYACCADWQPLSARR